MLEVQPDAAEEFSLLDETALLFRMLLAGGPEACQATNLLRALRQNRGAAALGLLETHEQRSGENTDIEASATTQPADFGLLRILHLLCKEWDIVPLAEIHAVLIMAGRALPQSTSVLMDVSAML